MGRLEDSFAEERVERLSDITSRVSDVLVEECAQYRDVEVLAMYLLTRCIGNMDTLEEKAHETARLMHALRGSAVELMAQEHE